jgi:hypothetical protein
MRLAEDIKLAEVIKWECDPKTQKGNFVIASKETGVEQKDVDELLRHYGNTNGGDIKAEHNAFAAAITEPINQAVGYVRWANKFYNQVSVGDLEDNRIPVEYYTTIAWETGPDAEAMFVRPGFGWTRPTFRMFQTGIEMPWSVMARSGWNVLARMMRRATEDLARKIDLAAISVLDIAVDAQAGHSTVVGGGLMTKASLDAVIKSANALGFPMTTACINSGTVTDMSAFSGGPFSVYGVPEGVATQLLNMLSLGQYGGINFYSNPFVPAALVYLGGNTDGIGYEQVRGSGRNASDIDVRKGVDLHVIITPEYAWYVGNALNLRKLRIGA